MVRERFEVLHDGREVELVARTDEAAQTHSLKAMVGLQMRKAHLDPLPLIAGLLDLRRAHECARMVTGFFVHVAWHFALRYVWAALRLQDAGTAIELARPVEDRAAVMHPTSRPQRLAVRAPVLGLLLVESEVAAREGAVVTVALVPDRDVRRDAGVDELAPELACSIDLVGGMPIGLHVERDARIQNRRSLSRNRGRGCLRCRTRSC